MEVVLTSRGGGFVTPRMEHQHASPSPVPRPVLMGSDFEASLSLTKLGGDAIGVIAFLILYNLALIL